MKKVLYVDMDGVIVDFVSAFPRVSPEMLVEHENRVDEIPDLFSLMDPMPGAIEAVTELAQLFDLYILSSVPWGSINGASDKILWVKKHFGDTAGTPLYKRVILSHNKHLNRGDFLIDDRPGHNGADKFGDFGGELIHFAGPDFPDWESVVTYLRAKA